MDQLIRDFTLWMKQYGRQNLNDPMARICYMEFRQEIMTAMVTEGRRSM